MNISACIITLNEERNLPRCLKSIASLVDEIVVVDSGSTDRTAEIARESGARVLAQPWLGYVGQKNFALEQAAHPWILSIDADEEVSAELAAAILEVKSGHLHSAPDIHGYAVSRIVFYRGQWIRHGDWYPDHLVRLFRRDAAHFTGGLVHEKLEISGPTPLLPGHLHHYTYTGPADRAERCARYAELWAQSAHAAGKQAGPLAAPLHAVARFFKGYILKAGFLDGAVGLDIALGNAREVALKYRLLRGLNEQPCL